jgi:UDP-2,3-diacylglucosamine hydrolase
VDLVSDLHLGPEVPATVEAFTAYLLGTRADAVLLLGDVFDVWFGDDALDDRGKFEARMCESLRRISERKALAFLPGNRDFLVGARFIAGARMLALDDPTLLTGWGRRLLLMHGDALCLDDQPYQAFRRQVRSADWQSAFLARPLAERQALAARMREASEARKQDLGPEGYGDLDRPALLAALTAAGADTVVHGHTHRPGTEALDDTRQRWVLSDWDLEPSTRQPRAQVLRFSAAGLQRLSPAQACANIDPDTTQR